MQFTDIQSLVQGSFQAVDALLLRSVRSPITLIQTLGEYLLGSGGKRVRPLTLLLSAQACAYTGEIHIPLAAVIQLIHTATLLHDDVVDEATTRRGQETANTVWGNEAAILVGDFLYSKAFQLLVSLKDLSLLEIFANTTNAMAESEALQLVQRHNLDTTEAIYFQIIEGKTAKLFEAAAQLGASIATDHVECIQALAAYGRHLGMAFQLIDDLLDYDGERTGKSNGADFLEGKVTLPLIYALQYEGARSEIQTALKASDPTAFRSVLSLIHRQGILDTVRARARQEAEKAQACLSGLPGSPYREALHTLAAFAITRDH